MLARSWAVLGDQGASRRHLLRALRLDPGLLRRAVGAAAARRVAREALRLALLTEIPAPYRIPLFNALAERLDLRVLFLAERDPRRGFYELHRDEWRFDHRVLRGPQLRRGGALARAQPRRLARAAALPPRRRRRRRLEPARVLARARLLPARGGSRCSSGSSPPPATRARRRGRSRSPERAMVRGASGAFVPGTAAARVRALARRRSSSRPRRTRSTRRSSSAPPSIAPGATAARSSTSGGSIRRRGSTRCSRRSATCPASSCSSARERRGATARAGRRTRALRRREGPRRARRLLPRRRRLRPAVALRAVGHGAERGRRRRACRSSRPRSPARRTT